MKEKFSNPGYALSACFGLLVLVTNSGGPGATARERLTTLDLPCLKLSGTTTEITTCQYLGSWPLPDETEKADLSKFYWRDVARLDFGDDHSSFQIDSDVPKLTGSASQLVTSDIEAVVFDGIEWKSSQVSLFAFRCVSPMKQTVLAEIDTNNSIALYVNGTLARSASGADNEELGTHLLLPVNLGMGENAIILKLVSNEGPPRLRMSLILDQSKDFQAAWNGSWGFLDKLFYYSSGDSYETPVVKWDTDLARMSIGVEVSDALTGKILIKKEKLRNGNVVRDGKNVLSDGIYKISYNSNYPTSKTASEYFLVGPPKKAFDAIKGTLAGLVWENDEQLNIEAQTKRAEILFDKNNYDAENKQWQEKVLYTLGSLAEFARLKEAKTVNIFKNMRGLQLKGFVSNIDNSKQFYRLFIPSNYEAGKPLPLLLIMPTSVSAIEKPFLESPFVASHRKAVQMSRFAEKYGFGVLWPGYRNALAGWTYEAVRTEEALEAVERDYAIDKSRISVYGICSGGFFAGRQAATYPKRYAAIVYDRAIFARNGEIIKNMPNSMKDWFRTINPTGPIIANRNLKILVLNDGTKIAGHGEIELSKQFLHTALTKRDDVKYALGQRKMGISLWDSIFEFLLDCRNDRPDRDKADIPSEHGYAGPISEVFGTPFIVVEGTTGLNREGKYFMDIAINNLMAKYQKRFYGAKFILKRDIDVTDDEIEKYSLVLVGNAESNIIWGRLAAKYPDGLARYNPSDNWSSLSTKEAFAEVFRNPASMGNYLLFVGANKLNNMELLKNFDPFISWFDCYIHKSLGGLERQRIFSYRPKEILANQQHE